MAAVGGNQVQGQLRAAGQGGRVVAAAVRAARRDHVRCSPPCPPVRPGAFSLWQRWGWGWIGVSRVGGRWVRQPAVRAVLGHHPARVTPLTSHPSCPVWISRHPVEVRVLRPCLIQVDKQHFHLRAVSRLPNTHSQAWRLWSAVASDLAGVGPGETFATTKHVCVCLSFMNLRSLRLHERWVKDPEKYRVQLDIHSALDFESRQSIAQRLSWPRMSSHSSSGISGSASCWRAQWGLSASQKYGKRVGMPHLRVVLPQPRGALQHSRRSTSTQCRCQIRVPFHRPACANQRRCECTFKQMIQHGTTHPTATEPPWQHERDRYQIGPPCSD